MSPTALSPCLQQEFYRLVKFSKTVCLWCHCTILNVTHELHVFVHSMFVGDLKEYLCFQMI